MLTCPGCGSNLTYDIDKGRLFCAYCHSDFEPADKRLRQKMASEQEIIPFSVTKNQCIETFNKLARGTLYAPREFRGAPGEGKRRRRLCTQGEGWKMEHDEYRENALVYGYLYGYCAVHHRGNA